MSGRRGRNAGIRGPHSALTDFLAANNISAQEIRDSYRLRREQAEAAEAAEATASGEGPSGPATSGDNEAKEDEEEEEEDVGVGDDNDEVTQAESSAMAAERSRKRKRAQEETIAKIKKSKVNKKKAVAKKKKAGSDNESDFEMGEMYKKAKPLPGQLENCELCEKRFTVTAYSKAGPDGGLLCTPCGKEMTKEAKATEKVNKPVVRKARRKIESNRLDGFTRGSKTLQQLCIEKLAKHSEDIDEFGEMPEAIMNRLSEIFGKKRAMNSTTFKLFLQPDLEKLAIHEAAYLETEDFNQIFAVIPTIKKLSLRNCCQFKDANMEYMIEKAKSLRDLELRGANLVSNDNWINFFISRGGDLRSLKLEWLDAAFNDQAVEALSTFCINLERLKFERCKQLGVESIDAIARLKNLQHLTLKFFSEVPRERLINLISCVGPKLRTLCLENFLDATEEPDDDILNTIHSTCHHLQKFRFSDNNECTDAGYINLFTEWTNPPLKYVDVSSTRDLDNTNPSGPEDFPIGLASAGFTALMAHSGSKIEYLDIASCRHISHEAFAEAFDGKKQYHFLREINMSFCPVVDTQIVAAIFRSCPSIKKVVTFGCFGVQDVVVPRGIVLIGAPKAHDAIEQFGDTIMDFQRETQREMERDRAAGRVVPVMG